jgi:hypothetical protein
MNIKLITINNEMIAAKLNNTLPASTTALKQAASLYNILASSEYKRMGRCSGVDNDRLIEQLSRNVTTIRCAHYLLN